ncbi:glycosyltransferase family 1 protein [Paenibacillus silvisoli]|uniref:glycosyltransferase family 1 protein n=1 Tax=Paenibacillus silvisoli TaxID=3110539 RepID=UPI00280496F3|nr:glycosyltransferase family 1 protein [Paenibacillus silvisoli]
MKVVKILHIVSSLSVGSGVMGIIMNVYRNLNREKIQFDFIYFIEASNSYQKEIEALGGNCIKINRPSLSFATIREINDFFSRNSWKYTAMHNHEVYINFLFAPIAKKNGIRNVITHSHTTKYSDRKFSAIRNKVLCFPVRRQADYYFACSKAAAKFLYGEKSLQEKKTYILNNAVDVEKFTFNKEKSEYIKRQLGLEGKLVIGHIGRFNEQKNHEFLIEIFSEINKVNNDAILILAGTGPLEEKIVAKVKKYNLENHVKFLGQRNDINELLQAMDALVLPSLYEGLPVVGVEAQAAGLPCFFSENITNEVGVCNAIFISLSESSATWANKILKYIHKFVRVDTAPIIVRNGFEIKTETEKLEFFYLNLTK